MGQAVRYGRRAPAASGRPAGPSTLHADGVAYHRGGRRPDRRSCDPDGLVQWL